MKNLCNCLSVSQFCLDANELRRKLARGDEEQAEKTRQFNEEVMYSL